MQIHQLRANLGNKAKKRVGRGGKRGTYSGRGMKGQKSRSGRRIRPQFRDILKKIPKKKGYRAKTIPSRIASINLRDIEKFENGSEISPKILAERGLVKMISGKVPKVKILGTGKLSKSFVFKNCLFSKKAEEAVKKSGSRIILPDRWFVLCGKIWYYRAMNTVIIPKNLEKKIKNASEIMGLSREELFMNAILYYFETMKRKIDLKKELEVWESISDLDLLKFERGL